MQIFLNIFNVFQCDSGPYTGGKPPQAEFASALEQLVDREVAFEDEVAAIFDLRDGVEARPSNHEFPLAIVASVQI